MLSIIGEKTLLVKSFIYIDLIGINYHLRAPNYSPPACKAVPCRQSLFSEFFVKDVIVYLFNEQNVVSKEWSAQFKNTKLFNEETPCFIKLW